MDDWTGWLFGWLDDWNRWLVGWLGGWMVGGLDGWRVGLTSWLDGWMTGLDGWMDDERYMVSYQLLVGWFPPKYITTTTGPDTGTETVYKL